MRNTDWQPTKNKIFFLDYSLILTNITLNHPKNKCLGAKKGDYNIEKKDVSLDSTDMTDMFSLESTYGNTVQEPQKYLRKNSVKKEKNTSTVAKIFQTDQINSSAHESIKLMIPRLLKMDSIPVQFAPRN